MSRSWSFVETWTSFLERTSSSITDGKSQGLIIFNTTTLLYIAIFSAIFHWTIDITWCVSMRCLEHSVLGMRSAPSVGLRSGECCRVVFGCFLHSAHGWLENPLWMEVLNGCKSLIIGPFFIAMITGGYTGLCPSKSERLRHSQEVDCSMAWLMRILICDKSSLSEYRNISRNINHPNVCCLRWTTSWSYTFLISSD